ncbi:MAG: hypothetical protein RBT51_11480, partial [Ectothiorhodospiraceae bacterium]|nr:hypothetical protein [Ectothiorhodospiraceae bacterium]
MKRKIATVVALLPLLGAGAAQAEGFAVGVKAGTTGVGVEGIASLSPYLNARIGYSGLTFDGKTTYNDKKTEWDADLNLGLASLLVDLHPFNNNFRITAGIAYNNSDLTGTLKSKTAGSTINIGDTDYLVSAISPANAEIEFDEFAPYIGIGYGNPVHEDNRLSLYVDLGVTQLKSGSATVSANCNAALDPQCANTAQFANDIAKEQ